MNSNAPLITNLSTQQINASLIALRNNISESSGNFIELEGNITSLNEQYNSLNKDVNCLIYEVECIKCCTGNVSKDIPNMKNDIEALQSDVANVTCLTCTINNDIGELKTCTTSICSCINCYIFRDYTYCCINGSCVSIGKHVNCLSNVSKDIPKMKNDIEALQKDVSNVTCLTCTINDDIGNLKTCTTNICSCVNCYIFRDYTYCCINGSCVSIGKHVNCLSSDLSSCISSLKTYVQQTLAGYSRTMEQMRLSLQNQINSLSDRVSALEND